VHLHHLQGVLTLCFATVTTLFKLQLSKISRLKCSHDLCWMIKYSRSTVSNYSTCKLFVWWLHIHSAQSCVVIPMLMFPVCWYDDNTIIIIIIISDYFQFGGCNSNLRTALMYIQQDATLHSLFYLENVLHVSGSTITHHVLWVV